MDLIARSNYGTGDWATRSFLISLEMKVMVRAKDKGIDWFKIFQKTFLKEEAAGDRKSALVMWARLEQKSSEEKNETLGQRIAEPTRQSWSWKHLTKNLGWWWKLLETASEAS